MIKSAALRVGSGVLRLDSARFAGLRFAAQAAKPASVSSPSANSFVSLGQFETLANDKGRVATGIAYLEDTVRILEPEYENETIPRRRASKGLSLAESRLQVARQHHASSEDSFDSLAHYERAKELVESSLTFYQQEHEKGDNPAKVNLKAMQYALFMLTEVCSGLGVALSDVGREDEAEVLLKKALTDRRELMGKKHASVAECLNNLGAVYFKRENYQRSVEYYEQALELFTEAIEGREEGIFIGLTLYNIGTCKVKLGLVGPGISALKRALAITENSVGSEHPRVRMIRDTLESLVPST